MSELYWNDHYQRWAEERYCEQGYLVRILHPSCFSEHAKPTTRPLGRLWAQRISRSKERVYSFEDIGREPDGTVVLAWCFLSEKECPPPEPEYGEEVKAMLQRMGTRNV